MYLTFYNLSVLPFHITPDPRFLYLSPSHKEALASIVYGIEQKKGFVAITGAVGVGKTTILRSYLQTAQKKRSRIVYIFNAKLTFVELLRAIYKELEIKAEHTDDPTEMAEKFYEYLLDEYQAGRSVVLVIDEAQNMPVDTLESLRMLSNFETPTEKLLQIVLVGQPEFSDLLESERLRPLHQRLAIRSTILPLTKSESQDYIKFRISKAGSAPDMVFTPSALKAIVAASKGIPRTINILCDNALITGFGYRTQPVTKKIAREIIRDFKGIRPRSLIRWWFSGASVLAVFCALFLWFSLGQKGTAERHADPLPVAAAGSAVAAPAQSDAVKKEGRELLAPRTAGASSVPDTVDKVQARRVVSRGDSLSKLAQEIYGRSNTELIELIKRENPHITNPNLILAGSIINLPRVAGQEKSR